MFVEREARVLAAQMEAAGIKVGDIPFISQAESLLKDVMIGVDLATAVLEGKTAEVWKCWGCPTCQLAVLEISQKACAAAADAACKDITGMACSGVSACGDIVCPIVDPMLSGACQKVLQLITGVQDFDGIPFQVCKAVHMCAASDIDYSKPLPPGTQDCKVQL